MTKTKNSLKSFKKVKYAENGKSIMTYQNAKYQQNPEAQLAYKKHIKNADSIKIEKLK